MTSTKRCNKTNVVVNATSDVSPCEADGHPCEIVALFAPHYQGDLAEAKAISSTYFPCDQCRVGEKQVRDLAGVRFGKLERKILLDLARSKDGRVLVEPEGEPSRAKLEAHRRAARKLERTGLVDRYDEDFARKSKKLRGRTHWTVVDGKPGWGCYTWTRMLRARGVRKTPLGELLLEKIYPALEAGRPIRWNKSVDGIAKRIRKPTKTLTRMFYKRMREMIGFAAGLNRLCSMRPRVGRQLTPENRTREEARHRRIDHNREVEGAVLEAVASAIGKSPRRRPSNLASADANSKAGNPARPADSGEGATEDA